MYSWLIYSLKVNVSLLIFFSLYSCLFKNDTFFKLKRVYFLVAILFSLIYPVIDFSLFMFIEKEPPVVYAIYLESVEVLVKNVSQAIDWVNIIGIGSIIISGFLLVRLLIQLFFLFKIYFQSEIHYTEGRLKLFAINTYNINPFSFFNWIFINSENISKEELNDILIHEKAHAKQMHSLDVLLIEILCIVFWWNPFNWLLKKQLKMNLEYVADEKVIRTTNDMKSYQYHLLYMTHKKTAAVIVNNFNVSQLKKRIVMINKRKSEKKKLTIYLLAIPLMGLLSFSNFLSASGQFSQKELIESGKQPEDTIYNMVDVLPQFPGGVNALMNFLATNIKYPENAEEVGGASTRVVIKFVVRETGKIGDITIVKSAFPAFDEEAIRAIKSMPDWIPGERQGKKVAVYYTIPIKFDVK